MIGQGKGGENSVTSNPGQLCGTLNKAGKPEVNIRRVKKE
jgi:hypothetical protein